MCGLEPLLSVGEQLAGRLAKIRALASEVDEKADQVAKLRYDKTKRDVSFKYGQKVILFTDRFEVGSRKLQTLSSGLFTVIEQVSPVNVKIRKDPTGKVQRVHVLRVQLFKARSSFLEMASSSNTPIAKSAPRRASPTERKSEIVHVLPTRSESQPHVIESIGNDVKPIILQKKLGTEGTKFQVQHFAPAPAIVREWVDTSDLDSELIREFDRSQRRARRR
jgi:hypothetical protein